VVLDPFAGIGTVGEAACNLNRRFMLFEVNTAYVETMKKNMLKWPNQETSNVNWINCSPPRERQENLKFQKPPKGKNKRHG